jgi:ribosome-associated protein
LALARVIAMAAVEKQATEIVILDLRQLDAITDCFVICTGNVDQQVRAIAENIEKEVKSKTADRLLHREGMDTLNWVILDYVNVVVHVFKPSFREFYRLENLWGDAELIPFEDDATAIRRPRKTSKSAATARSSFPKTRPKKTVVKKEGTKPASKPATRTSRKQT